MRKRCLIEKHSGEADLLVGGDDVETPVLVEVGQRQRPATLVRSHVDRPGKRVRFVRVPARTLTVLDP